MKKGGILTSEARALNLTENVPRKAERSTAAVIERDSHSTQPAPLWYDRLAKPIRNRVAIDDLLCPCRFPGSVVLFDDSYVRQAPFYACRPHVEPFPR